MGERDKITVLFVNPSAGLSGDTLSLGNLIESLRDKIEPIVLLTEKGSPAFEYFSSLGVECICHPYLLLLEPPFWEKTKNVIFHLWRLRIVKWLRFELPCLLYVKKMLKDRDVDVVHSNRSQVLIGCRLARSLGVPHVWHIREYALYGGRRIFRGLTRLKRIINNAEARIVISNPCREWWNLKDDNTWTINDAVRRVEDCCYVAEKHPYILFLSHLFYDAKGARKAVEAYGRSGLFVVSHLNHVPIRMKMVGNCQEDFRRTLMALAEEYGCEGYIDFIPEQKDVKSFFIHAMVFVNPSVNEGMGRTTAEAMFYGCPVVAHASGGTLDLIKNGETGFLFNTVEECAEQLKKACFSNQEEVIFRAQAFAKRFLSIEGYGERIMTVYNQVLGNNQG